MKFSLVWVINRKKWKAHRFYPILHVSNSSLQEGSLPVTIGTSRYQYGWGYQTILGQSKLQCQQVSFKGMYRVTLGDFEVAGSVDHNGLHKFHRAAQPPGVTHGSWTSRTTMEFSYGPQIMFFHPQKHPGQGFSSTPCYQLQSLHKPAGSPDRAASPGRLVESSPNWRSIVLDRPRKGDRTQNISESSKISKSWTLFFIPPILGTPHTYTKGVKPAVLFFPTHLFEKMIENDRVGWANEEIDDHQSLRWYWLTYFFLQKKQQKLGDGLTQNWVSSNNKWIQKDHWDPLNVGRGWLRNPETTERMVESL